MPDVRYVCLSDLHFGAQNSLLTNLSGLEADPSSPSATLQDLVACLAALVESNEDRSAKPVLLLNGDAVDFALASDEVAVMAFEQFVRIAFVERDLFSHTVHYVPGNHDHHMWETAREGQYAAYIARQAAGARINPPWHGTSMFPAEDEATRRKRKVEAHILQSVMQRYPRLTDASVEVHYPSLGLRSDQDRGVIFNHGHYIDALYMLMTRLKSTLFPGSKPALTPWALESENFAWIDFFWSTLGRSGDWGSDVTVLYDMLQDDKAVGVLAGNLATVATNAKMLRAVPAPIRRWIASAVFGRIGSRVAQLERHAPGPDPLSAAGQTGLHTYVSGPVRRQVQQELGDKIPSRITFVFGHTHKPYASTERFDGYTGPLDLYNTGGWVVDSVVASAAQGAAVVLLDEELNCAAIHLYDEGQPAGSSSVQVRSAPGSAGNAFESRLRGLVDPAAQPWSGFSARIQPTVASRREDLKAMIARGVAAARSSGPRPA
jgi:hypothetical protein